MITENVNTCNIPFNYKKKFVEQQLQERFRVTK